MLSTTNNKFPLLMLNSNIPPTITINITANYHYSGKTTNYYPCYLMFVTGDTSTLYNYIPIEQNYDNFTPKTYTTTYWASQSITFVSFVMLPLALDPTQYFKNKTAFNVISDNSPFTVSIISLNFTGTYSANGTNYTSSMNFINSLDITNTLLKYVPTYSTTTNYLLTIPDDSIVLKNTAYNYITCKPDYVNNKANTSVNGVLMVDNIQTASSGYIGVKGKVQVETIQPLTNNTITIKNDSGYDFITMNPATSVNSVNGVYNSILNVNGATNLQ